MTGQLAQWRALQAALHERGQAADADADAEYPLRVADDVLAGVGHALMCWAWARIARVALQDQAPPQAGGRDAAQWLQSARFGLQWLLPQADLHWGRALRRDAELPFLLA